MNNNSNSSICIVVVLFNPNIDQINNIKAMSNHYTVVAVDNSVRESELNGLQYIFLQGNKGIATAQNVGIRWAKEKGFEYILLLDQDSKIDRGFVNGLYRDFLQIKGNDSQIGFLGPIFIDSKSNQEYKNYTDKTEEFSKTNAIIASGSFISMEALESAGLMDESLFIDLVDFEWCWRAVSKGYTGYMTRNVQMIHSIGKEYHNWHGFVLGISAPFRYYYQYRNTLWLAKRGYVPLKWKVKSIVRRTIDIFIVPLASDNGWSVLKHILKGIKDGLFIKNVITY